MLREVRTAVDGYHVAKATHRRRRILLCRNFFHNLQAELTGETIVLFQGIVIILRYHKYFF